MPTFAVRTMRGPGWDATRGIREQADWDAHARFMDGLVAAGLIVVGGPIGEDGALLLVEALDEAEIRRRLGEDPWQQSRTLHVGAIEPGQIWLDGRAEPH